MRTSKPSLIRNRRQLPLFRHYPDVFIGCEAVTWAMKSLKIHDKSKLIGTNTMVVIFSGEQRCKCYHFSLGLTRAANSKELDLFAEFEKNLI